MFKLTTLITLRPETSASERQLLVNTLRQAAASERRVKRVLLQPTLPGVHHGGDFILHLQFTDEEEYRAVIAGRTWQDRVASALASGAVAHVDSAAYLPGAAAISDPGIRGGVYRTLFTTIRPAIAPEKIVQFEKEMCEMPRYIHSIRNWAFSRVIESSGARRWTHVWEQDYHDIGGLMGPYMMHPHHWGFIDRWYDHESPDWIVDGYLCHTFCAFDVSMLTDSPQPMQ